MPVVPYFPLSEDPAEREAQVLHCLRVYEGRSCYFSYKGQDTTGPDGSLLRDGVPTTRDDSYLILKIDEAEKAVTVRNCSTRAEVIVPFLKVTEISQIVMP